MSLPFSPPPFPPTMAIATDPAPITSPQLMILNEALATSLGFSAEWLRSTEGVAMLSGQARLNNITPVAQAYAGHQFGQFVPQLGDGRAHLIGLATGTDGKEYDIQLKGSGPTPFSRRGDGRAAIGPVLREYIVSESMAALGVPTTRALSAVLSGETVWRDKPHKGAILARVAASHLRVGTFQYFAAREDHEALRFLCDLAVSRHYPELREADQPIRALYEAVVLAQANLVARWMSLGFIHGVMNTDNMAISGETIDYGPCAFMDKYEASKVFSSIDRGGRYAYANQPQLAGWNLARLAETLLPFFDSDEEEALLYAQQALACFRPQYEQAYRNRMKRKLGLQLEDHRDDALIADLLQTMEKSGLDWTLTFRRLSRDNAVETLPALGKWITEWKARRALEQTSIAAQEAVMLESNPAVIPRNHRIAEAISAAEDNDLQPLHNLMQRTTRPYDDDADYETPPQPEEVVQATFCGT